MTRFCILIILYVKMVYFVSNVIGADFRVEYTLCSPIAEMMFSSQSSG